MITDALCDVATVGIDPVALMPRTGESQREHFNRVMSLLESQLPSVNRRTLAVLELWNESPAAQAIRAKALRQFPVARFKHFSPRCIFLEHTLPADEMGRPEQHYGEQELEALVLWANYRIENADSFTAITEGHTPTREELISGQPMPDVLGYAGPFFLGRHGDVNPRWAIYAEEWIYRTDLDRFERRQRRSPEVWINEPLSRRTMDPIAALGAETPRLDCGLNPYCRPSDGQTVLRYSALAPRESDLSRPEPVNVSGRPSSPGDRSMPVNSTSSAVTPAITIDAALVERTVRQAVVDTLPILLQSMGSPPAVGALPPEAAGSRPATGLPTEEDLALAEAERDLCQQYSAGSDEFRRAFRAGWNRGRAASPDAPGSDLHQVVARQQARLQELSDQLAQERRDAARYSKLCALAQQFAFDPRDEAETCRDMSDTQFERHCSATIVKYARCDELTGVELFHDPHLSTDPLGRSRPNVEQLERYSREAAATAARKNAVQRGATTFEAEFAAICRQHGLTV